jgi:hypothetical protein
MAANLTVAYSRPATEVQRVGRKSDADYDRDGHKYLTPEQLEALIKAARTNRSA